MAEKNIVKKDLTDFPFEEVSNLKWLISFIVLVGGFIFVTNFLILLPIKITNPYAVGFLFLFFCILSLLILDKKAIIKLFKPLKKRDIAVVLSTIIIAYILAIVVSMGQKDLVKNPITQVINNRTIFKILFLTAFQLIGEEILFVVPFLFIYNKLKYRTSRNVAIIIAWIISSLFFGMLHLQTYSFNIFQALILIGAIRMGISLSYILTKNLTASYLAHFLYDSMILVGVAFAASKGIV